MKTSNVLFLCSVSPQVRGKKLHYYAVGYDKFGPLKEERMTQVRNIKGSAKMPFGSLAKGEVILKVFPPQHTHNSSAVHEAKVRV